MNNWLKSTGIGMAAGLLVFLFSMGKEDEQKKMTWSAEYKLGITPDTANKQPFSYSAVVMALKQRLKKAEYEFTIIEEKPGKLQVTVKGLSDTAGSRKILTASGRLQFRELYSLNDQPIINMLSSKFFSGKEAATETAVQTIKEDEAHKRDTSLADGLPVSKEATDTKTGGIFHLLEIYPAPYISEKGITVYPGEIGYIKESDKTEFLNLMQADGVKAITPTDLRVLFGSPGKDAEKKKEKKLPVYFIRTFGAAKAKIENKDIIDASARYNQYNSVEIVMQMRESGKVKWANMTRANVNKSIAIILDDEVLTAPNVNEPIVDGSSVITGNYTIDDAMGFATSILSPELEGRVSVLSEKISPEKTAAFRLRELLIPFIAFIIFSGFALFLFKSLKTT